MTHTERLRPTRRTAVLGALGATVLGTAGAAAVTGSRPAAAEEPRAASADRVALFDKGQSTEYECYRIPALLATASGTVLAFAEGRRDFDGEKFCYDDGSIDIVLKRSEDGGRSWEAQEVILTGNPWGGEAEATRGNPVPILIEQGERAGRIVLLTTWNQAGTREKRIPFVMHSDDEGKSWSEARSLEDQLKGGDAAPVTGWYATGPQHGIQMVHGEHAGRLVAGVCYEGGHGAIIYSDDDGETWAQGQGLAMPEGYDHFSEVGVEETAEGHLLAIGRGSTPDRDPGQSRAAALSTDGGETFEGERFETVTDLETTPGVQGALLNRDRTVGEPGDRLLYSAPSQGDERRDMAVFASEDAGASWARSVDVDSVRAGYSDMAVLDEDVLGLLHEAGDESGDARDRIDWHRLDLG